LKSCIEEATKLIAHTEQWLKKHHSQLA